MDIETFEIYRISAQPLEADDKSSLGALAADPMLADCTRLIEHLVTVGMKLEQEAVSVKRLMAQFDLYSASRSVPSAWA